MCPLALACVSLSIRASSSGQRHRCPVPAAGGRADEGGEAACAYVRACVAAVARAGAGGGSGVRSGLVRADDECMHACDLA